MILVIRENFFEGDAHLDHNPFFDFSCKNSKTSMSSSQFGNEPSSKQLFNQLHDNASLFYFNHTFINFSLSSKIFDVFGRYQY